MLIIYIMYGIDPYVVLFDSILQMASSSVARLDHFSSSSTASRLRGWFDDLPSPDRITVERLMGHSMSYLSFQVPDRFVEGILSHWISDHYVFRFGSLELTPIFKEYARITGLLLVGPYARVSVGHMRR